MQFSLLFFKHATLWCTLRKWLFIKKRQCNVAQCKQFVGDGTQPKNEQKNIKSEEITEVIYCQSLWGAGVKTVIQLYQPRVRLFCVCAETAASVYGSTVEILYIQNSKCLAISCLAISCLRFSCPALSCPAISRQAISVRQFHVLQFHALLYGPSVSSPAILYPSFSPPPRINVSAYWPLSAFET